MKLSAVPAQVQVVVVIPTKNRPELLFGRSLKSVFKQTLQPDRIIVVEDLPLTADISSVQEKIKNEYPSVEHLNNRRTPGLSGALNSALDHCLRYHYGSGSPFIAFLDDDDSWEEAHLEACIETVRETGANFVTSGLVRHDTAKDAGHLHSMPETLGSRQQFIRGQHIQGSNIFADLRLLLEAGGFDEALSSCTDRDLCLRLAEHPDTRFALTGQHTVHHYADPRPDRLSTANSLAKQKGLDAFFDKHAHHFDAEANNEAEERAERLFDWKAKRVPRGKKAVKPQPLSEGKAVQFLCGFITDPAPRAHVRELLEDLQRLSSHPRVEELEVLILENGPITSISPRPLHELVNDFRIQGLNITLITVERIMEDWAQGKLVDVPNPERQRLPIAVSRTLLNTYLYRHMEGREDVMVWVLDDDKRLEIRLDHGSEVEYLPSPQIDQLLALKAQGIDAVIGPDTDAAPLPFAGTIRMQLLDLNELLKTASQYPADDIYPPCQWTKARVTSGIDTFYDLARKTDHLETPGRLPAEFTGKTFGAVITELATKAERLLAGENIFRPLAVSVDELDISFARESNQRGGSTIFFNPRLLAAYPHTLARVGEQYVRRSDMIVSTLMSQHHGAKIVLHSSAGVRHNREHTTPQPVKTDSLAPDILGYALSRTVAELMEQRDRTDQSNALLAWTADELDEGSRLTVKYVEERLAALRLAAFRIQGLCKTIDRQVVNLTVLPAFQENPLQSSLSTLSREIRTIADSFEVEEIMKVADEIMGMISPQLARAALMSMDGLTDEYRRIMNFANAYHPDSEGRREQQARAKLASHGVSHESLRLLGAGGEGIVFTDGLSVYKVFDLLKHRPGHNTEEILKKLCQLPPKFRQIYRLDEVTDLNGCLLVKYPYEDSQPYEGGHGRDLINLLHECKRIGIVFRNMHPNNLRVASSGLKLIDYGSDIRPYSEAGFHSMAQRAWLTWRWHHRKDLNALMRVALKNDQIPELCGFDRFWQAINDPGLSATETVSNMVEPLIDEARGQKILDYGCGKKALTVRKLAQKSLRVIGFDPGEEMEKKWQDLPHQDGMPILTTKRSVAMEGGPYDAVVCSLVLCELEDGPEYEQVLRDLRSACGSSGKVIVTICNPLSLHSGPTSLHYEREIPDGKSYEDSFVYREKGWNRNWRREYHRPLDRIERDLLRFGLRVENRLESAATDTDRFEPDSDFLTLVCRPVKSADQSPAVTLLIKTCAMEVRTIERQVQHLIAQLEGPTGFAERLLVIDSLRDGFLRQYADGDYHGILEAAERLRRRGWIDRIIIGPAPGDETRRLNLDWFGEDIDSTHSRIGAPLSAPLKAFEECSTRYLLQVDSDLLVHRSERTVDYLTAMIESLENDPKAFTAALPIISREPKTYTAHDVDRPWRVEARACLFDIQRLIGARPFLNPVEGEYLSLSWHRAMDQAAQSQRIHSLRGSVQGVGFAHPSNELKRNLPEWMLFLDFFEKQSTIPDQAGHVDLKGGCLDWLPRQRHEPFVFLVTGRNTGISRVRRCINSIVAQNSQDWGVVLVDDASQPCTSTAIRLIAGELGSRVTLIQPRERLGQMQNMALAIRHICANPDTVIVTLDLDDELIGPHVLERLTARYAEGADCTIGSMLRTDKEAAYPVILNEPRKARGGNVWQHLRSFKKQLFDRIPDHELRHRGSYFDLAVDWAFMLPIVEMADQPAYVREPLYLYEPSGYGKGDQTADREAVISQIVQKRARTAYRSNPMNGLIQPEDVPICGWSERGGILFMRHAHRPRLHDIPEDGRDGVRLTAEGREATARLAQNLSPERIATSPIQRAVETGTIISEISRQPGPMILEDLLHFKGPDGDQLVFLKERMGWNGVMIAWMNGLIPPSVLLPCEIVTQNALNASLSCGSDKIISVTHDFVIMAILAAIRGERLTKIPYLGAVWVSPDEARDFTSTMS